MNRLGWVELVFESLCISLVQVILDCLILDDYIFLQES
jgi:hypothetical protein